MKGKMLSKVINEIVIIKELEILNSNEIKEKENEERVIECNGCDLKLMNGSEIEKLRMKIERVLRDEKLRVFKNIEVGKLREEVKEIMWGYFCENRFSLSEDIGDYREEIIVELMKGGGVKEVFEVYGGSGLVRVA